MASRLTVRDVLAEVALFGTGPEAITLLESLGGRAMTADDALEVAAAWEDVLLGVRSGGQR